MARFVYELSFSSMYHCPGGSFFVYDTKDVVLEDDQRWEDSFAKCICECWGDEDNAKTICDVLNAREEAKH
jgi:hypothetical protein